MRLVTVSVLSMMVCGAAFGDARLPVVNIGAGAVSARAAFGDVAPSKNTVAAIAPVASTRIVKSRPASRETVARAAKKQDAAPVQKTTSVDTGAQIAQNNSDILMPRRPSGDLWARSDATPDVALRMPRADEFSVIRSDAPLPEESLDTPMRASVQATPVEPVTVAQASSAQTDTVTARSGALDAEIAKLVDAHRRADEQKVAAVRSMPATTTGAVTPRRVMSRAGVRGVSTPRTAIAAEPVAPVAEPIVATATSVVKDTPVMAAETENPSVRRMIVPMASDVVVRAASKPAAVDSPVIARAETDMASMSPSELKKAFKKTFLSENKHLSTFQIDDRFDVASDMDTNFEGFTATRDLSEAGGVRPLEIKIKFRGDDASLSRENYNLLTEYASIVLANPKRAVQVSIPESLTRTSDARKLAARRLAIVEQVLRDTGVSEHRIMPVLAARDDQGFVLRMISNDQFETLTQQKRDMFGDTVGKKTYKSMTW